VKLKHPVVHGHPLHAMVSDLPIALIPLAFVASLVARRRTSRWLTGVAAAAAAGAVTLGWWDWLTIPRDHPAWRPATLHGLINTTVLGATTLALLRGRALALGAATAALTVSAWIGGDLVYRLGWRVRPAEELELIDQGDTREIALAKIEKHERDETFLP
jgi:uncharacterized membrane protein